MRIQQWLRELQVPAGRAILMRDIAFFGFGETYYMRLQDQRTFQDNDLDRLLQLMCEEFLAHNTTVTLLQRGHYIEPQLRYEAPATRSDPLGQRGRMELRVYPAEVPKNESITRHMDQSMVDLIYTKVTAYNITGEWTQFARENL